MHATKEMETKNHTMPSCQEDLDVLVEDARTNNETAGHALHGYMLGTKYTGNTWNLVPSLHFTNWVAKMQNDDMEIITSLERVACAVSLVSVNVD